jgi:hypothetical protein
MSGPTGSLSAGCPRCSTPVAQSADAWHCPEHGAVAPLWRPGLASYDAFVEHLAVAGSFPTYLPWPLSPGWHVTDFGVVGAGPHAAVATVTCSSGPSDLDGAVDLVVVSEEPGTGVGARCAGTPRTDPGPEVGDGPPLVHVRIGGREIPLWAVSTSDGGPDLDRTVVVGEAVGRWLWLVLRPASALLLLREDWILRDVSGAGPHLVEMPFGGPPPAW